MCPCPICREVRRVWGNIMDYLSSSSPCIRNIWKIDQEAKWELNYEICFIAWWSWIMISLSNCGQSRSLLLSPPKFRPRDLLVVIWDCKRSTLWQPYWAPGLYTFCKHCWVTASIPHSPPGPCSRCALQARSLQEQEQRGNLTLPADRPLRTATWRKQSCC